MRSTASQVSLPSESFLGHLTAYGHHPVFALCARQQVELNVGEILSRGAAMRKTTILLLWLVLLSPGILWAQDKDNTDERFKAMEERINALEAEVKA